MHSVVVAGSLAQRSGVGGHSWQFLNYLLGFKKLGWRVLFIDRIEPEMCVDAAGQPSTFAESVNLAYFLNVMNGFGFEKQFALIYDRGKQIVGLTRAEMIEQIQRAAIFLNVMGFLQDAELLDAAQRRVFVDTDPGFSQMWFEQGLANIFSGHDEYVTIAENIGRADCSIPTCGLNWIPWRQPVVLEQWPACHANGKHFTSIGAWRGPYDPIDYHGQVYGLRVHEFRKFAELPRLTTQPFEIALDIDSVETRDIETLRNYGWSLADPRHVAADPWIYRQYVQNSRAEFMVAKGMYVSSKSGWISERSICYLASGKPVLAQDTGVRHQYATGEGLILFSTLAEAALGVEEIASNYGRHSRAAREIAEKYFDSDKVIRELLEKLGIASG